MSSTPSASPQPPAGGPPAAPAKGSGGKVLLWILGGCATIVVLGVLAFAAIGFFVAHKVKEATKNPVMAAAKFMVAANPDLQTVSSDENTIVVRDRKTGKTSTMKVDPDAKTMTVTDENGKTVTMKLDPNNNRLVMTDDQGKTATITADTQAGNVEIKGPDGNFKMGAGADKPPAWVPQYPGANVQNVFSASNNVEQTGTYAFTTKDAPDKVLSYYDAALKSGGFTTSNTTNNTNGKVSGMVNGTADNNKRTVVVVVGSDDDGTKVSVTLGNKP
jgi:hypothetical protein